jgi:hypothetical protein
MQKEGMYYFFEIKETALRLVVPNMGSKWKRKKDVVNTFKVSTTSGLVTFITKIFGIPLMKHSWYALKHCLVDVKKERHLGISIQTQDYKEWGTNMGRLHSPNSPKERSPKELLLSVYTQIQEGSSGKLVIDPLFLGIVSFSGDNQIMSVSRGGNPDFEEFILSSFHQKYQE